VYARGSVGKALERVWNMSGREYGKECIRNKWSKEELNYAESTRLTVII